MKTNQLETVDWKPKMGYKIALENIKKEYIRKMNEYVELRKCDKYLPS